MLFTPELFCFVPGLTIVLNQLAYFSRCIVVKQTQVQYHIAGQSHDNNNTNNSTCGEGEMPRHLGRGTHFLDAGNHQESSEVYKVVSERTKERRYKRSGEQCSAKTAIHKGTRPSCQ